eukprot:SAG11_NODE_258_length_11542_cov_35.970899_15_plen_97_part_00
MKISQKKQFRGKFGTFSYQAVRKPRNLAQKGTSVRLYSVQLYSTAVPGRSYQVPGYCSTKFTKSGSYFFKLSLRERANSSCIRNSFIEKKRSKSEP